VIALLTGDPAVAVALLTLRPNIWYDGPVRAGDVELHLGVEDNFRPARKGHPDIVVTDLDDVVHRLIEAGQDVSWDANFPRLPARVRA